MNSFPDMSHTVQIDTNLTLPALIGDITGQRHSPTSHTWELCLRWDGEPHGAFPFESDVKPFPDPSEFGFDGMSIRQQGFGPVSELALAAWTLSNPAVPRTALFAVSTRLLSETAKLRAFRILQPDCVLWAIGDLRDLSSVDVESNRVRTTLQAVAALWGTASHVCVLPHNATVSGFSDPDAARHAANVGRLLKEESFSASFSDITAGAVFMDTAVNALVLSAAKRWDMFNELGASSLSNLLSHPDVEALRQGDAAWLDGPRARMDAERTVVGDTHFTKQS